MGWLQSDRAAPSHRRAATCWRVELPASCKLLTSPFAPNTRTHPTPTPTFTLPQPKPYQPQLHPSPNPTQNLPQPKPNPNPTGQPHPQLKRNAMVVGELVDIVSGEQRYLQRKLERHILTCVSGLWLQRRWRWAGLGYCFVDELVAGAGL